MRRAFFTLHRVTAVALLGIGGGFTGSAALLNLTGAPPPTGFIGAGLLMLTAGMAALLAESLWNHTATLLRLRAEVAAALAGGEASNRAVRRILDEGRVEV